MQTATTPQSRRRTNQVFFVRASCFPPSLKLRRTTVALREGGRGFVVAFRQAWLHPCSRESARSARERPLERLTNDRRRDRVPALVFAVGDVVAERLQPRHES